LIRRRFGQASARGRVLADEDLAVEEGAGGQHHDPGAETPTPRGHHSGDRGAPRVVAQVDDGVHEAGEVFLELEGLLGQGRVGGLVGLGPRRLDGRAAAAVEHAELDHRRVDQVAHLSA